MDGNEIIGEHIPEPTEVVQDIDLILWSIRLENIKRYHGQKYWEQETIATDYATRIEGVPRLESVAEHSWHVADIILLLGSRFSLDVFKCLRMAILHDKMEITIGDRSPVGRDGKGNQTHAFNLEKQHSKEIAEKNAIGRYTGRLSSPAQFTHRSDLLELLSGLTAEAKFVKAADKLQALAYVIVKKQGNLTDEHLLFTLRYSKKTIQYFPDLNDHYSELKNRLLRQVSRRRGITLVTLIAELTEGQLELDF